MVLKTGEVSIDDKVHFLQQPKAYSHQADDIISKETHMSWVFLVNGFVYKLKKPVAYDLFDHRTLESRFVNSREEIRINQSLAGDIYIGIVPLVLTKDGALQLEGRGKNVDWLVKMKRIPNEIMLDHVIQQGSINTDVLQKAAQLLIGFYKTAKPVLMYASQYITKLETDIRMNEGQFQNLSFQFYPERVKESSRVLLTFLSYHKSLFQERIKNRKIIDAHGDLRPEHICLGPDPVIIDRLEFCRELRVMDIAEELAFLSMECEILGNIHAGQVFIDEYIKATGDAVADSLFHFYKSKKAVVRAYLVARHVEEQQYSRDPKWMAKAHAYLSIAEKYCTKLAD